MNNQNHNLRGRFIYQFLLLTTCCLLLSCESANKKIEVPKSIDSSQETQPDSLLLEKELNGQADFDQDTLKIREKLLLPTDPIGEIFHRQSSREFKDHFSTPQGLNYADIVVPFPNNILNDLLKRNPGTKLKGLVFHYGLKADSKTLVYIISDGTKDKFTDEISYRPFDIDENGTTTQKFVLVHNSTTRPMEYIDTAEMCALTNRYCNTVEKSYAAPIKRRINCTVDAKLVYHEGSELLKFYNTYIGRPDLALYITHGSAYPTLPSDIEHTPLFTFGNKQSRFILADQPDGSGGFVNLGLDAGQLCPPLCATDQPNYCN